MAIKQGTGPSKIDHRDYDFHKSFGAISVPFPSVFNTDAGVTMPNQNADDYSFTPPVIAEPFGCTNETSSDIATDLNNGKPMNRPDTLEAITQANARGGYDVRQALLAGRQPYGYTGIFNIRAYGQDMFDAVRTAMISGGTEKRSVSVGTKWFPIFEAVDATGIIQAPDFNSTTFSWHNWKICGWKTINDQVYLVGKSWQGPNYGDKGLVYFSRPIFNQLMSIQGSVAFTATKGTLPPISTISVTWLQWLISNARNLFPY